MAFSRDVLVAGSYHGFNVYKLAADGLPDLLSSVVCPGGQGDVSIVGDLLIMSVEQTRGRVDCGLEGVSEDVSPDRFRGIRIFDISNLERPVQVGQVQTCRGSHSTPWSLGRMKPLRSLFTTLVRHASERMKSSIPALALSPVMIERHSFELT